MVTRMFAVVLLTAAVTPPARSADDPTADRMAKRDLSLEFRQLQEKIEAAQQINIEGLNRSVERDGDYKRRLKKFLDEWNRRKAPDTGK